MQKYAINLYCANFLAEKRGSLSIEKPKKASLKNIFLYFQLIFSVFQAQRHHLNTT